MTTLQENQQSLMVGKFVLLFSLDTTSYGGPIFYWTPSRTGIDVPIQWNGNLYTPIDFQASGFDKSTAGTLPRPQVSLGNADNIVGALLVQYGGLKGCQITRTKTLYEYLDDQPGADPTATWPIDYFRVERKISHNKKLVVLELAAATDNMGAQIPARIALRDICTQIYRVWDPTTSSFDYSRATCPYTGVSCFTEQDIECESDLDSCGRQLSSCKLRFGSDPLPTRAFPALAKVRL